MEVVVRPAQLHLTQLGIYITTGTRSHQAVSQGKAAASQVHFLEVSVVHRGEVCIQSWVMQIAS